MKLLSPSSISLSAIDDLAPPLLPRKWPLRRMTALLALHPIGAHTIIILDAKIRTRIKRTISNIRAHRNPVWREMWISNAISQRHKAPIHPTNVASLPSAHKYMIKAKTFAPSRQLKTTTKNKLGTHLKASAQSTASTKSWHLSLLLLLIETMQWR